MSIITKVTVLLGFLLQLFIFMGFIIYSVQKKIKKVNLLALLTISLFILSVYTFIVYLFL